MKINYFSKQKDLRNLIFWTTLKAATLVFERTKKYWRPAPLRGELNRCEVRRSKFTLHWAERPRSVDASLRSCFSSASSARRPRGWGDDAGATCLLPPFVQDVWRRKIRFLVSSHSLTWRILFPQRVKDTFTGWPNKVQLRKACMGRPSSFWSWPMDSLFWHGSSALWTWLLFLDKPQPQQFGRSSPKSWPGWVLLTVGEVSMKHGMVRKPWMIKSRSSFISIRESRVFGKGVQVRGKWSCCRSSWAPLERGVKARGTTARTPNCLGYSEHLT